MLKLLIDYSLLIDLFLSPSKVCLDIGACAPSQFEFQSTPAIKQQEHWDDKCFVCQAFAKDLEVRVKIEYIFDCPG